MIQEGLPARAGGARRWKAWLADAGQAYGAPAALALLVLLNVLFTPKFATTGNLWNILLQVSTVVLVAVGMTVVIATCGIDLSVGSLMAVGSTLAVMAMGRGAGAAMAAGLGAAVGLGLVNGVLVAWFRVQPFITTLAMLITARGLALVLSNEGELTPFRNPTFEYLGGGYVGPVPVPVLISAAVVALAVFVTRATTFGRYLVAVGGNERAARLAGVNVGRTKLAAYAVSGLLAGVAGLIETARLGVSDPTNVGLGMEFAGIAAAVIGGTPLGGGRAPILGAVFGALIMAVIGTSFNMLLVPYAWALLLQAGIILGAVYVQRPRVV